MIELKNIVKKFNIGTPDESVIFDNFNFKIDAGEFVSVIGSNGSGKTTLLNLICGTLRPEAGSVLFREKEINRLPEFKRAKYIGRVFQDPKAGTCPSLTILENMALADNKNKVFGLSIAISKKRREYYAQLLSDCGMGLENRMDAKVGTLSGGQRQALALVIANMTDIDLLILDEHTAALDPKSSETIMELTDKIVSENRITTVMVTHNLRFAVNYGSRLVMMHEGNAVMDIRGKEKSALTVNDILDKFNEISIESGN